MKDAPCKKRKIVTLPENYTIIDGIIYDTNTGLRYGCILRCSGGVGWSHCNISDDGECPHCEHISRKAKARCKKRSGEVE